ncbi:zinc-binding dehydrogenase [Arthrobacter sp. NPDC056727]|uniref:zinc-binding dehydrogenase n=1 Tax=Arthrobacter sp. NPDC056727 TaxID=3345927 RepID=UPI00366F54CE
MSFPEREWMSCSTGSAYRKDFRALLGLLRGGQIHPVVAERLPLPEARRAHKLLEHSAETGKLVLVPAGAQGAG